MTVGRLSVPHLLDRSIMTVHHHFFQYNNAGIHYLSQGNGSKILLTFHGFGQDALAFQPLTEQLKEAYTIYSFYLFFHGKSTWYNKAIPFTKTDWKNILHFFLKKHNISSFELLGYSMGAKMVLSTIEICPEKINKAILLSPDGIKTSFWYNLSTFPFLMQYLFRHTVNNPAIYFSLVSVLRMLRIIDKGIIRFTNNHMDTKSKRYRLYRTWTTYRNFSFKQNVLLNQIHAYNIPVRLFTGRTDKIVPYERIHAFVNNLKHYELSILNTGHTQLINKVAEYYLKRSGIGPANTSF